MVSEALSSPQVSRVALTSEEFQREHLRVLAATLIQKIDELHDVERQATESLTLLEAIQSSAPVGFGFVDREYRLRRVNDVLAAFGGAPAEQLLGREVADVVPELWAQLEPAYEQVLAMGEPVVNHEVHGETSAAPGEIRSWLTNYYPVWIEGEISGIGMVVVDITDRLAAEEFRSVVMDNMAEGLFALDSEGRLMFMNVAASKMLGWSRGGIARQADARRDPLSARGWIFVSSGQVRLAEGCGREPRHPRGR